MKKIAVCGSSKNHEKIKNLVKALENKGFYIFLFPDARHLFTPDLTQMIKYLMATGLTLDHFEKIKKSDIVLFANYDGYIGNSATMELGVAVASSKIIVALNHDEELARECMFNTIIESEDENVIAKFFATKFK